MDVVWCLFPFEEKPGVPGPEPHPGLIFETREFRPGEYAVKVVYGTSNTRRPGSPHFIVSNFNAMKYAGLNCVTIFDLGRSKWLPWTDGFFRSPDLAKYPTPKIGCIKEDGQGALAAVLAERAARGLPNP